MIPVTDAYPALLRLTLRCLTCHGGVGVLLGCIFFFFSPFFFSLLVECSFRAAIYSISIAYSCFSFSFFPSFLFLFFWVCSIGAARLYRLILFFSFSFFSFGCVHSGLLQVDYRLIFFPPLGDFLFGYSTFTHTIIT